MRNYLLIILALLIPITATAQVPQLAEPYQVKLADGSPLDTGGIGHAAPYYGDFDGDKVPDLLVGEFKDGALRIYKNYGTAHKPIFKTHEFFVAGGKQAIVPPD